MSPFSYLALAALSGMHVMQVEQSQMALTRKKAVAMVKMIPVMTWDATKALTLFIWEIMRNPRVLKEKLAEAQYHLKEVSHLCSLNSPLNAKPCARWTAISSPRY